MPSANPKKIQSFLVRHQGSGGKNSSFSSSSKGRRGCSLILSFYGAVWCFCLGQRPSTGREKTGEGTFPFFLNLPTSFLSLSTHLYFSIISSPPLPFFSLLSLCLYLYDILARRFISLPSPYLLQRLLFISLLPLALLFGIGKMMKKLWVSMDPTPSTSFLGGEGARARFKHQCLLQDYQDLIKETEEKKDKLHKALQSKLKLLAEVKFLRKKFRTLSNTPHTLPCKLKKQSNKTLSHSKQVIRPLYRGAETELPLKERNHKLKDISIHTAPKLLDLNQVSLPNGEDMEAFEAEWEAEKPKRSFIEGDAMADDLKLSGCRDIASGQNRGVKRKISWQDQLALRV